MSTPPGRRFDERNERSMNIIRGILEDHSLDMRLTPGQLHAAAVEALGCEPIVFVCNLLAMCLHARSKITIHPTEAAKLALMVMDRIYGPPDSKVARRPADEDQFELEFAWARGVKVKAEGEL